MLEPRKHTPEWFKSKISLTDFIVAYSEGRVELSRDSTNRSPKVHLLDDSGYRLQTLNIKQNKLGYETYFIQGSDNSGGKSIFDFVIEYNLMLWNRKLGFRDALKEVVRLTSKEDWDQIRTFTPTVKGDHEKAKYINRKYLSPLEDRGYFYSRGITDETIDAPIFKGVIFNHRFQKDIDGEEKVFQNVAFQMFQFPTKDDPKELVCISSKNRVRRTTDGVGEEGINIKHFQGTRSKGVVASKPMKKQLEILFVMESFDDCLAHFQVNRQILNQESIGYVSTEGQITNDQIDVIRRIVELRGVSELAFGFDNDRDGDYYRCKVCSKLIKGPVSIQIRKPMKDQPDSKFDLHLELLEEGRREEALKFFDSEFKKIDLSAGKLKRSRGTEPSVYEYTIPNTVENWRGISQFFISLLNENPKLRRVRDLMIYDARSRKKDWGEDLVAF